MTRATVRRAYGPTGPCGWDVLITGPDRAPEWADRTPTRDDARELARQWNVINTN